MVTLAALLIISVGLCSSALADDPNDPIFPDTLRLGCPVQIGWPLPESIGVPLYIYADDTVGSFSAGFTCDSEYLTWSSFSHEGTILPASWFWPEPFFVPEEKQILVGAVDITGLDNSIFPQGLIGTLYMQVDPGIPAASAWNIDSVKVGGSGDFIITIIHAGPPSYTVGIKPVYADCGLEDILIDPLPCGDANGDGTPNISDAVFLIAYIFAGGPAPDPLELGDCNCDDSTNISDAVYLIQWIFAGGPAPCEECP
jgi:hypothetical protein